MPFQEDFSEFLDESQGFAVKAKITPAQGHPYQIIGILANEYLEIDGGMAGFSGSRPVFEMAEDKAKGIEYGDLLTAQKINYRIIGIRPDGTGWLVLELERQ